jgi:hypothetical protein
VAEQIRALGRLRYEPAVPILIGLWEGSWSSRLRWPPPMLCSGSGQAVYQPGSVLLRPSPLGPPRSPPLRTGRDHRRAQQRAERRRSKFEQPMLTIHQRPFQPADRSQAGHW